MERFSDPTRRVNYVAWVLRVVAWDGALPLAMLSLPYLIGLLLAPRGAIELTAIITPIAAFFIRLRAGSRHINANHCSSAVKRAQVIVLFCGVFFLVFIDAVIILAHVMPKGALHWEDFLVLVILGLIYVSAMVFAMYPGREPVGDVAVAWSESADTT